ncbi:hypothetical protein LDENG_00173040 [Lucifuga dentata]|nr:hypothetical protein LDENG_00173040 [Lucifuga dentata]
MSHICAKLKRILRIPKLVVDSWFSYEGERERRRIPPLTERPLVPPSQPCQETAKATGADQSGISISVPESHCEVPTRNKRRYLKCAAPRTAAVLDIPIDGFSNDSSTGSSSGDTGGKRDLNQTLNSRLKRKTLAVDFAVPSLLRYYLAEFIKRPLNGDCQTLHGCYTVRANLKLHCIPLQKTISTFIEPKSAGIDAAASRNMSADGQLPFFYKRPLSKVLKLGLTKASRKSNQVVVEIGEDLVRTGCGGLSVYEEAPVITLEMDLTTILEWWLGADGGRLRVRLMPEKKAQVPGIEDRGALEL